MKKLNLGTAVPLYLEFRDRDNALMDPTTAKITILDPDGDKRIDAVDLVKDGTGLYHYYFQSEFTDKKGLYRVMFVPTTIVEEIAYRIVDIVTAFQLV